MSKIVLDEITSGYQLSKVNENFQRIEDELNNKVLYRNAPDGETNTVEKDIDLNGKKLYNVGDIQFQGFDSLEDLLERTTTAAEESEASKDAAEVAAENAAISAASASTYSGSAVVRTFSGDGSTVAFNLTASPLTKENTQVYIGSVYQRKSTYSVTDNILTFNTAPPVGTNNIEVVIFESVFVEQSGYTLPVLYGAGILLNQYNQLIEYNDEFYKLKAGQAPYTTTGTWSTDSEKLIAVGDAALRQELITNANDFNLIPEVANYAAVRAGLGGAQAVYVRGRSNIFDGGAGIFRLKVGDTTSGDNDGTVLVDGVSGARYFREFSGPVSGLWFGAVGDAETDDHGAIQKALDTRLLVTLPQRIYKTTLPLVIGVGYAGLCGNGNHEVWGTVIDYYGPDAGIKVFDSGPNKRVTSYLVRDLAIKVRAVGAQGIDFSHGSYGVWQNVWIRLLGAGQSGVYGMGNSLGSAPYYNHFDNIKIFGNANAVAYPNQRGFHFVGDGSGLGADGPNANIISNCGQITGLSHGVHVESGVGNLFSNIVMETISEYAYRFGNAATAAPGRADENMVVNHWMEGASSCVLVRFEGDAHANSITNYSVNSTSSVLWDNQSSSVDNYVKAKGNLYVVDFYAEDIPASATTVLRPTSNTQPVLGFGGVIVPLRVIPYLMQVTVNNFSSGGNGAGVVRAYRTGVPIPALQFTVQNASRFGGKAVQRTPNAAEAHNTFDGSINSQIEVTITTDADWDQSSADVHVQVVFVG